MKKETVKIEGMHCASCARYVEKAASSLTGVKNASVNLATEKMTVAYDETKVSLKEIAMAVKAGYELIEEAEAVKNCCKFSIIGILRQRLKSYLSGKSKKQMSICPRNAIVSYDPKKHL